MPITPSILDAPCGSFALWERTLPVAMPTYRVLKLLLRTAEEVTAHFRPVRVLEFQVAESACGGEIELPPIIENPNEGRLVYTTPNTFAYTEGTVISFAAVAKEGCAFFYWDLPCNRLSQPHDA